MLQESSDHISPEMIEQILKAGLPESDTDAIAGHLRLCSDCRCRVEVHQFWDGFNVG